MEELEEVEEEEEEVHGVRVVSHCRGKISETKVGVCVCAARGTMAALCQRATSKAALSDCSEFYFVVDH